MTIKTLLVALSTSRTVDGKPKRVRFAAGQTVELTDNELETLTNLEKSTGALQFRDPNNEAVVSQGEAGPARRFIGEDTSIDKKNVDQLKAFLTFYGVEFADKAKKDDLLALANDVDVKAAEAALLVDAGGDGEGGEGGDPDAGL